MSGREGFARDPATAHYYERRAEEYDEWYRGEGVFASRARPGWHDEVRTLGALFEALAPASTLDVACGTAYLSRHLIGPVLGVDQSPSMVAIARERLAGVAVADALCLPVASGALARVFTGHFYGHLGPSEREAFVAEARRVAPELVVVDSALRQGVEPEGWQVRTLNDGSRHTVYKRYLAPGQLAAELGGSVLFAGTWFVAAQAFSARR